ncbi:GntR family transcriptional regulator [Bacillus sp. ISL-40]|uniref:GntR family transcriptional regulator n=1 Tax=unclassified Bacillus (in: firmicutes) TaxID=185979 RepID=UPI001BE90DBF|nr:MULTISPECIES: GntR family transcriptional regulator [unclassified Bacillus (in: firmicutes)]MBT2696623.1 GntR family transcriptional regulator [Bacillus sp. ISL-40]MBT2740833.1 GntR family transcriptional regulator [Bacillus sp. ISL-77]
MSDFAIERPIPYYEKLYHSIKKMIFEGKLKPGERIIETQLAKDFNVSKSPIREAIRILEKEGLVIVDEKSRVMVYQPTMKDVEEIYFCRMALESFAVGLVTRIATNAELDEIEKTLMQTEQAIRDSQSNDTIITLNEIFHSLIIQYTQNRRLQKQLSDLKSLMYFFRVLNFQGENRADIILIQHRGIFDCIKKREADQASQAMINHLKLDLEHLTEVLSNSSEQTKP